MSRINYLNDIVEHLVKDTLDVSLPGFLPELTLCATIVVMLLLRVVSGRATEGPIRFIASWLPLLGSGLALYFAAPWANLESAGTAEPNLGQPIFTGMLLYDQLTVFFRAFLMFFLVLFVIFTQLSGIPDREDAVDFYTLVLGSTIGMCLMVSANHMLIVFLGIEMASVPSYALAGMLKGRRTASEAALKFAVYGAGAAGVMLYGISLLAGVLGSVHLPTMAVRLAELLESGAGTDRYMVLVLAGLMIAVGLAFKLSAVPFHFWCPDVFEGASAEAAAFFSVASKGAALALLVRLVIGFGYIAAPAESTATAAVPVVVVNQAEQPAADDGDQAGAHAAQIEALSPVRRFMSLLIGVLAAITCTFGNLAAYGQTNIKRLLAYSTIAHAGYMMMPVAAAIVLMGTSPSAAEGAITSLAFYAAVYLFMNLGAFAIVAFLRNAMRSEEIADYGGLVRQCPGVVLLMAMIMFSLVGMPPLAGFVAKFAIFGSLVDARMWTLLVIGGLNTVVSLFYYLRVIKTMTLDPEPEDRLPVSLSLSSVAGVYLVAITLPVLVLGLWGNGLIVWARAAASHLL